MDDLEDLREILDPEDLILPIGGTQYVVKPCTADVFLRLQAIADAIDRKQTNPKQAGECETDLDMYRLALGDTFAQLAPNVTGPELERCGMTAWFFQIGNKAMAAAYWRLGKAPAPVESTSTSTGEATGTPQPASGSGTRSRKKSSGDSTLPLPTQD